MEDKLPDPVTIRHQGRKYDVSFYPTPHYLPAGVICLIRGHRTGKPYIGTAFLSPSEKAENISPKLAVQISLYRAVEQIVWDYLRESVERSDNDSDASAWVKGMVMFGDEIKSSIYSLVRYQALPPEKRAELEAKISELKSLAHETAAKLIAVRKKEKWQKRYDAKMAAKKVENQEN